MSLPNGMNYFELLLLKSLLVKQYKLVSRDYLEQEIFNSKRCDCKYCGKFRLIKRELRKRGFNSTNSGGGYLKKGVKLQLFPNERSAECLLFLFVAVGSPIGRQLEKANMMMLTKEATEKDRSLKTQLLVSTSGNNDDKISGERVWKKDDFFRDVSFFLKFEKRNIPGIASCISTRLIIHRKIW